MRSIVVVVAVLAMLVMAAVLYLVTPSVYTVRSAHRLTVHCEVLGDYPSDVARIEIVEQKSSRIVWRIKAQGDMFQLHKFDVVSGPNAGGVQPFWGRFQTEIPTQGSFELKPGVAYRASVCSADWLRLCRGVAFTL
jgi:hypothetical protein